ncbi:hypothetical protein ACEN9X_19890 [Mucilaginibacter sp. Mucisp86]|uniref:hypothetical protein n=1 Tax=Mucilaginibacter sp. Mucisp86 TaxID=3243060 RepID=UPI0039B55366
MKILTLAPHKPITYVPGLISLVLFPMLCLMFLYQHKAFVHRGALNIAIVDPDMDRLIAKKYHVKIPPERSYTNVNLTGNAMGDQSLLEFARFEIKSMIRIKSKTLGIRFHFGNKMKYQTFVSVIDMCSVEEAIAWIPLNDDIYVFYVKARY